MALKTETNADLRQAAVWALAEHETDEAVKILLWVVKNDKSVKVRTTAVHALGEIGTPAAQQALLDVLGGDED